MIYILAVILRRIALAFSLEQRSCGAHLGFNEVGVRPNYYPSLLSPKKQTASFSHQKIGSKNLREDAIIMAKSL